MPTVSTEVRQDRLISIIEKMLLEEWQKENHLKKQRIQLPAEPQEHHSY